MEKEFLLKLAEDVSTLAEDIEKLAEETGNSSQEEKVSPLKKAQAEVISSQEPEPTEKEEEVPPEKPVSLPEVRAVLAEKSREGHTKEVKALINSLGADRLSEVDPSQYPALLKEAEVI
jgi:hypothetical protein